MTKGWIASLLLIVSIGCAGRKPIIYSETGTASWYGWKYAGKRTASGERFWPGKKVAAHRTLPLGTKAVVTNLSNGRRVKVRIIDRGPVPEDRVLDLSKRMARKLRFKRKGLTEVRIEVQGWPSGGARPPAQRPIESPKVGDEGPPPSQGVPGVHPRF